MVIPRPRRTDAGSHAQRRAGAQCEAGDAPPSGDALIEGLYTHHGAALLGYLRALGTGHQDAEDVVQETMVRAWRHQAMLDPTNSAIRGWLYTVARNILIDRLRKRSTIPAGIELDGAKTATEDHVTTIVERVTLLDALARLTPEQRVPIIEVCYRGRTVNSVAASLGVPVGTVKSRLHYGLRNLRDLLDNESDRRPR